jgi:hypothetical protein
MIRDYDLVAFLLSEVPFRSQVVGNLFDSLLNCYLVGPQMNFRGFRSFIGCRYASEV